MLASFRGYQSLVENSPDAISLVSQSGEILYGSASCIKLLGYLPQELVGLGCLELLHPEDRPRAASLLNEVIQGTAGPHTWDARVRRKDGNYCWVESTVTNLLQDSDVRAVVMYQRDIHDRMESNEQSKLQADNLRRSNLRMEEFAYTVAHDLREPLRAISIYTQLLFSNVELDAQGKQMAQFVVEGAQRMAVMVSDLLAFARSGMPAPPVRLSLANAVAQASQNLSLEIQESAASIAVKPLPTIYSDEVHMVRVFQNLISNAIKYRSKKPLSVEIAAEQREQDCVIKVRDNGIGIAPEFQASIFLPFVRLGTRNVPGTGLGLAVCKRAIEGLGGKLWVESDVGAGSTFAFTIPTPAQTFPAAVTQHV